MTNHAKMDKFVLRGEAAKAATESRQRRQNAPPPQRQLRIDDLRATVVLPTSNLHPDPEELLRLARVVRDEGESEREVSRALLALGAYDVSARDLERGREVAAAVRWRRGHGPGHGPPAPGGLATRSPELAAALLAKWRGRVLEDARRQRRQQRREKGSLRGFVVVAGGGEGGAGGAGGGGAAAGGTGLEEEEDEVEEDD